MVTKISTGKLWTFFASVPFMIVCFGLSVHFFVFYEPKNFDAIARAVILLLLGVFYLFFIVASRKLIFSKVEISQSGISAYCFKKQWFCEKWEDLHYVGIYQYHLRYSIIIKHMYFSTIPIVIDGKVIKKKSSKALTIAISDKRLALFQDKLEGIEIIDHGMVR